MNNRRQQRFDRSVREAERAYRKARDAREIAAHMTRCEDCVSGIHPCYLTRCFIREFGADSLPKPELTAVSGGR